MPAFDLSGELSLKIELHMLRPITEKVHSGNGPVSLVRNELFCIDQTQSFYTLFTGGRDFFSLRSYTILSKCIEFCFGKVLPISKFQGMKNGSFYLIGESLNNF